MKNLLIFFFTFCSLVSFSQRKMVISSNGGTDSYSPPSNVVYLSKAGIVSDAVLDTGQTNFGTDQTAAIQAILNTASKAKPLNLLWDVKASCTGLKIKSYTTINALPGCGAILRDNVDNWLLSNYNWTANSNNILDSFITINGGIWNANGWRGGVQKQANNTHDKGQITLINFFGVKNVNLENCTFLNASTWCVAFMTSENVYINNCIVDDGTGHYNQDGIDFLGRAKNVTITNCIISNGDDKITLCPNSTGGTYSQNGPNGTIVVDHSVYTGVDGDQTNFRIDNIVFKGYGKGFAFYVQGGNKVSDIHVSNISGTCQSLWLDIENYLTGYTMTSGSQICHNLTFENIGVEVTSYVGYGDAEFPLANIMCSVDNLVFRNVSRNSYAQNAVSFKFKRATGAPAVTIDNLIIDGFYSVNTNPGNYPSPGSVAVENATVNRLSVLNAYCDFGTPDWIDRPLLNINSTSTVHNLFLQNINFKPFKSLVGIQGTVDYLMMNNVIHRASADSTGTLNITGTLTKAVVSNYIGKLLYTGTIDTLAQSNSITTP